MAPILLTAATLDSNGRLVVTNPGTIASPNLLPGTSYSVNVTTTDINGGISTRTITFTIGAYPLPMVLTAFTAQTVQNRDALLSWATASEQRSASFEVKRSPDSGTFTKIGQVAAPGHYRFGYRLHHHRRGQWHSRSGLGVLPPAAARPQWRGILLADAHRKLHQGSCRSVKRLSQSGYYPHLARPECPAGLRLLPGGGA